MSKYLSHKELQSAINALLTCDSRVSDSPHLRNLLLEQHRRAVPVEVAESTHKYAILFKVGKDDNIHKSSLNAYRCSTLDVDTLEGATSAYLAKVREGGTIIKAHYGLYRRPTGSDTWTLVGLKSDVLPATVKGEVL